MFFVLYSPPYKTYISEAGLTYKLQEARIFKLGLADANTKLVRLISEPAIPIDLPRAIDAAWEPRTIELRLTEAR